MRWETLYDFASQSPPHVGVLLLMSLGLLAISAWLFFRFARGGFDPNGPTGWLISAIPGCFGLVIAWWAASVVLTHNQLRHARFEHGCEWREGRVTAHSGPDPNFHQLMSISVEGRAFPYDQQSPGFSSPACQASSPCDGDYIRLCVYGSDILKIDRRR